ncbi:MAG: Hsp70 family protein [Verrucomicrobiaceae bacterium]|nr:Hsp70 family protein [Verrucomicrobiaceae bacterium]
MSGFILGIDLGTTNSLVGVVDSGFPILLADAAGERLTPSAVHVAADGTLTVGAAALRRRVLEPSRTITSVKRLIGHRAGEAGWEPPYDLKALGLTPVEVSAAILGHLKSVAESALEQEVTRAVITVPAFFNDAQRAATREAGERAGLTVERILSEPTAAALAYGLDKLEGRRRIAVYDLGGGTFDVSVLELREGVFEVLATAGDTRLGGDDLDRSLAVAIWKKAAPEGSPDWENLEMGKRVRLIEAAEGVKKTLSTQAVAPVELPFFLEAWSLAVEVTRAELDALARPWVEATRKHCLRALSDAGLKPAELDEVVLVGGSTRMPLVRERVAEWFGREPCTTQHPDEAIALGAVIQGGVLSGSLRQVLLLDVTPLSLGIETFGGLMNVIIPRNSTLPCKAGELFTNAVSGQASMLIRVLQGERELAKDNWELGRVEVPFTPGPKGSARVGVQFALNVDGLLEVLTRDTVTGVDTVLAIQRTAVDVNDEAVEKMIAESVEFALEDMSERQWTEAALKGRELIEAVKAALDQLGEAISTEESAALSALAEAVERELQATTHQVAALKAANQALDDATQELAVRLIEQAMEASLARRGLAD